MRSGGDATLLAQVVGVPQARVQQLVPWGVNDTTEVVLPAIPPDLDKHMHDLSRGH